MSQSTRRQVLQFLLASGAGGPAFCAALADEAATSGALTADQIAAFESITGMSLSVDERTALAESTESLLQKLQRIRSHDVPRQQVPALRFDPEAGNAVAREAWGRMRAWQQQPAAEVEAVSTADGTRWQPIRQLAADLRGGRVSSVQLTRECLSRLEAADEQLHCVVNLTAERALRQAEQADKELAAGVDRGLLHGIPWGAKDLLAVPGVPTTWGAPQFQEQILDEPAAVVQKLDASGAVLVAKLSTGALAMGDRWFGGQTRNPWDLEEGSSGSSAGSAAAVAAGLVPFAIGSETLGSIVSPSRRCGVAGLRPTFGRVSRSGCMPLSWSMDKLGPFARCCDDLGVILQHIHGADAGDPSSVDRWYEWPIGVNFSALRVGRVTNTKAVPEEQRTLAALEQLGARIQDVELPREFGEYDLTLMLEVEAATVFQELTNQGVSEGLNSWPQIFQRARLVTAVDYLQASRIRRMLMERMAEVFERVDVYVGGGDLGITNLTGHPTLSMPVMMRDDAVQPVCCSLTAGLYDEATLLAIGAAIEPEVRMLQHRPAL